ncbi:MAG: hypothetical protein KJ876_08460, partial [Alphaproteobacteria bacterium]|nr:hypothetical protein [Alphaproteobacteria bacterium]
MLRFVLALQAMGEIPPDFDLKKVQPSVDSIVVTARRQNQRIDSAPVTEEPPLGRAEMELFGKVKGNVRV